MSMEKKKILNFAELTRFARPGRDFLIEHRNGTSGLAIMAPHGGGIEPGPLGKRETFADIGQTLASYFDLDATDYGRSFLDAA